MFLKCSCYWNTEVKTQPWTKLENSILRRICFLCIRGTKSVQIWSSSWSVFSYTRTVLSPNMGNYTPEKIPKSDILRSAWNSFNPLKHSRFIKYGWPFWDIMHYKTNITQNFWKLPYLSKQLCLNCFLYKELSFSRLTLSWRSSLSYRNQSIHLLCKSMDWFLYDRDLRHERVLKT